LINMIEEPKATPSNGHAENVSDVRKIEPPREPEYDTIEPEKVRVFADSTGRIRATFDSDKSQLDIKVVRCFPQSDPDHFWALLHRDNRVIGVIADPEELDEESRKTSLRCIEGVYFLPCITAVHSLKEEFGAIYFEVETDRGPRSFVSKGVREALEEMGDGEIILTDVHENRYTIRNVESMDQKSRRLLERII